VNFISVGLYVVAEQYLGEFGKLAQKNNTMIIPSNLSDIGGMVAAIGKIFSALRPGEESETKKA
jgi:hypothetical protein